jgi:fructokinase
MKKKQPIAVKPPAEFRRRIRDTGPALTLSRALVYNATHCLAFPMRSGRQDDVNFKRAAGLFSMILVLGEILFDLFPAYRRIGGAPFNFAFHLRQLGFDVAFVSRVGRDALGDEILSFIGEKGFDPGHIQVDPDHATGTVDITVDAGGDHQFHIVPDRAYDHIQWEDALKTLCRSQPDMVYFGTLIQRTAAGEAIVDRVLSSSGETAQHFCDINLRPDCWTRPVAERSISRSHILKLNQEELDILAPETFGDAASRAAGLLSPGGPSLVILTRGEKGELWATDQGVRTCPSGSDPAGSVEVADTVGAGDAYAAMAAAGRLAGLPDEETMGMAREFAGFICTVQGALPQDTSVYQAYKKRMTHG